MKLTSHEKRLRHSIGFGFLPCFLLGGIMGWSWGFNLLINAAGPDANWDQPGLGLLFYATGVLGAGAGALIFGVVGLAVAYKVSHWMSRRGDD